MKVLIIDDEPQLRNMFARVLSRDGYEVEGAGAGRDALESVKRGSPDLVLLDLHLPDLNGLEVLDRIAKSSPSVPVVMMTGQGDVATAVRAMKLGATDFLLKPFDAMHLSATVRTLLERNQGLEAGLVTRPIISQSPEMSEVWTQVARYALPDVSILLTGESGTGKELFARAIHDRSKRRDKPFVALDCATLPETLVESEIFGHERGAFTGAAERKVGKFELAQGGTIFLDEIGNLPLAFQAKLLRVVQERYVDRLGGNRSIPVDVRIVTATNLDLEQAIRKGTFRQDLYYRLAEVTVRLPTLKERRGDLEVLADHFIREFNHRFGRQVQGISDEAWKILRPYAWPGNVRELENVIKSSLLAADEVISTEHLPGYLCSPAAAAADGEADHGDLRVRIRRQVESGLQNGSLDLKRLVLAYGEEIEREVLLELLRRRDFTQVELCDLLHVDAKTLRAKLQRSGLRTR
jgi:DNA-binding NtrC family response regulator